MKTAQSRWNARNREKMLAINRAWYARHAERERERNRIYQREHLSERNERQLARQRKTGVISQVTLGEIYDYYGTDCVYCGEPAKGVDHLQPVTKDGSNDAPNLAPCCQHCNSVKYNRPIWTMLCLTK